MKKWTIMLLAVVACFVFACGKDKPISPKIEHYRGDWKEYDRFPIMKGKLSPEQAEKLGLKEERTKIPYLASVYKGRGVWKDEILSPGTRVLMNKKTGLIKYIAKCGNKAFIPVQIPECPSAGPGWRWTWPWNFNLPWWLPLLLLIPLLAWISILIGRALRGGGAGPKNIPSPPEKGSKGATIIPGVGTIKGKSEDSPKTKSVWVDFQPNPDAIVMHTPKKLTDASIVSFDSPDTKKKIQTPMIRELFGIPGVTSIAVQPYEMTILKGHTFSWDDILPKADEVVKKHMGDPLVKGEFSEEEALPEVTEGSYIGILYARDGIHIPNDGLREVNAIKATKDGNMLIDVVLNKSLKKEGTLGLPPGETGFAVTLSEDGNFKVSGDGIKPAPDIQLGKGNSGSVFIRAEIAKP